MKDEVIRAVAPVWQRIEANRARWVKRVLEAFRRARVSEADLASSSGYGYDAPGRDKLERIYAELFGTEKALVREQIVSGTHAVAVALFGLLRPGDELLSLTGPPYDTLRPVIDGGAGSLKEWGVSYREVDIASSGPPMDPTAFLGPKTRLVFVQRSAGYRYRRALSAREIGNLAQAIKATRPEVLILVDNCYGEFVEEAEPTEYGADIVAGSLIKNPGGGLALGGGYLAGRGDLIDLAAARLTAPGIGGDVGPYLAGPRHLFMGLFLAPHFVAEALKGAVFTARLFADAGYTVRPSWDESRADIVQIIRLGSAAKLTAFCEAVQQSSPINSFARPEAGDLPGYGDPVVMAAGGFVQGASLELSADAPLRPPYDVFLQGGLVSDQVMLAALTALDRVGPAGPL